MNRFLGLSGVVHIGLIAGVLYIGAKNDFSPHKVIESMNFEAFGGEGSGSVAELKGAQESTEIKAETLPVETISTEKTAAAVISKAETMKALPVKSKSTSKKMAPLKAAQIGQKQMIDDSADPELDDSVVEEAISEVKKSTVAPVVVEKTQEKSQETEDNSQEAIASAQEQESHSQVDEESEKIAAEQAETEKIADEKAKLEKAEADKAKAEQAKKVALLNDLRKQNAEREAKEAAEAAALAANESAKSSASSEKSDSSGLGSSDKGEGPKEGETVHALTEFKQIGGNPKPKYDSEDRMKGRAGTVTFQAFVNKEGSLNDFQLIESSGHRTLDAKTLQALKKWKFAAGQEGWIEIPFQWDLKGGAQEVSPLRTSRSATTK
jgi:TonB family protein